MAFSNIIKEPQVIILKIHMLRFPVNNEKFMSFMLATFRQNFIIVKISIHVRAW